MTLVGTWGRSPFSISMILSGSVHLSLLFLLVQTPEKIPDVFTEIQLVEIESAAESAPETIMVPPQAEVLPKEVSPVPIENTSVERVTNESASEASGTAEELTAQERYKRQIARLLNERKSYPKLAKQLRQQGRVLVQFLVSSSGQILEAKVVSSSPFESLNKSAESLVKNLDGLNPFPNEIKKTTWLFTVPVDYQM